MVLHLVTKRKATPSLSIIRALTPEEDAALCRVKQGIDLPGENPVYRATVGGARADELWILCDCREGSARERPVIVPVREANGQFHLSSIGMADVPHVEGCVFAPGEGARRRMPAIIYRDVLRPVARGRAGTDEAEPGKGRRRRLTGPGTDSQSTSLTGHLHRLMQAASLHRLSVSDKFASPGDWLAAIDRAAGTFRTLENMRTDSVLFTDPRAWRSGRVVKLLDRLDRQRSKKEGPPSAWLCWLARDIDGGEVNRAHPALGHVRVLADMYFPIVMGRRMEGPWLFLGEVGRSRETGRWQCLDAIARPIASACCPVPVDSHNERRALGALRSLIRNLESDAELGGALGGAVRVDLEKPLFDIETVGGPCRPDFILTVIRPGRDPAEDRHQLGDSARFVIEVMGLDNPDYERAKAKTHPRMMNLGRILPLNARRFDSRGDGIQRQADRIARRIRNNLMLRWGAGRSV